MNYVFGCLFLQFKAGREFRQIISTQTLMNLQCSGLFEWAQWPFPSTQLTHRPFCTCPHAYIPTSRSSLHYLVKQIGNHHRVSHGICQAITHVDPPVVNAQGSRTVAFHEIIGDEGRRKWCATCFSGKRNRKISENTMTACAQDMASFLAFLV